MAEWHYVADGKPVGPVTADYIHEKFRDGVIGHNTLVWADGMPGWQPIHEVEDFSSLTKRNVPPPIPGTPPSASVVSGPAAEPDPVPIPEIDEKPTAEKETEQVELSNLRMSEPRIPWSRYFARTFDVSVLGTLLLTAAVFAAPYISLPFSLWIYAADARALLLLALPFVMVLNAIIITAFGNSMGKKLFGIHALNVQENRPFTFAENVGREMRVWGRGMALGIPIVNFFTMIPAFQRVASGKPTLYDEGIASVRPYSDSTVRRTIGFLVTALVLIAILASNAIEKQAMDRLARPYAWINPKTSLSTTIPAGWQHETIPGPGTGLLYAFTNLETGVVAFLAVETAEELTLASYADALEVSLSKTMNFEDDWTQYDLPEVWKRSATIKDGNHPSALLLRQVDSSFWRVVYVDQLSKNRNVDNPELTRALFASVGVK